MQLTKLFWLASWCVLALTLSGCPRTAGLDDPLSPRADLRVTQVAVPGGTLLAPVLAAGTTNTTATLEFPQASVDVTVFNGVSTSLTAYGVEYRHADGVTPFGPQPLNAALSQFLQAELITNGFNATTLTLTLPLVSGELRSVFAGPDALLGTDDDFRSNALGVITIVGRDINGNTVSATGLVTITARPQVPADP